MFRKLINYQMCNLLCCKTHTYLRLMSLASHMSLATLRHERKSNGQYSVLAITQIGSPQTQQVRSQCESLLTHTFHIQISFLRDTSCSSKTHESFTFD